VTSSTSLISFRLEELSKHLTAGGGKSYWFMFEPLLMSKAIFDKMPKAHQDLLTSVGAEMEAFGRQAAMADDDEVVKVYRKAGAQVHPLENDVLEKWKAIARETAWKDYAAKNANCARFIKLAEEA